VTLVALDTIIVLAYLLTYLGIVQINLDSNAIVDLHLHTRFYCDLNKSEFGFAHHYYTGYADAV